MADNNIRDRLALITGASGGIGSACAKQLASEGCHLALTYSSNRTAIDALTTTLQTSHPHLTITTHSIDMSSPDAITALIPAVQTAHKRPIQILIANAGYGKRITELEDIPLSEWEHTINVNLRAPFLLTQAVIKDMKSQNWGRIVFTSSIAAYGTSINGAHYAASKGGLLALTKRLATQLAPFGISVNDVAPAMVGGTGMIPDEGSVPGVVEGIPLGRLCEPEEVGNAVTMFVKTGFVTGQSLLVAGGLK